MSLTKAKLQSIPEVHRKRIGHELMLLGQSYWSHIPLNRVSAILAQYNIVLTQEDGTEWSGLICGEEGHALFTLAFKSPGTEELVPSKQGLQLSWYKMPSTRYEIVAYVS